MLTQENCLFLVLLDPSAAFDTIHLGILNNMLSLWVDIAGTDLNLSSLFNRKFFASVGVPLCYPKHEPQKKKRKRKLCTSCSYLYTYR